MAMDLYSLLAEMELAERMGLNANQFDKIVFAKWANSVEARHNVVSSHNTSANHSLAVGESLVVPTSKIYVNYYIDYERDYAPDKYFVYGLQISNSGVVCSAYDLWPDARHYWQYPTTLGMRLVFAIDLAQQPADVHKLVLLHSARQPLSNTTSLSFSAYTTNTPFGNEHSGTSLFQATIPVKDRTESTLIWGEFYRYKGQWKFCRVDQGANDGLLPLLVKHEPQVEMQKLLLTKHLTKLLSNVPLCKVQYLNQDDSIFRVSLNDGALPHQLSHSFSSNTSHEAGNLDLGAYVRLSNGYQTIVQAQFNSFGHFHTPPFVELKNAAITDDKADGVWIEINSQYINLISEIAIFIVDRGVGAAQWSDSDAFVTVNIIGLPKVEIPLDEPTGVDSTQGICSIARIRIDDDKIFLERNFREHKDRSVIHGR